MKKYLRFYGIVLLLFISLASKAQTVFAPIGAEWYNDMTPNPEYGVFHSYYYGDTTILGIACRMVARKANTTAYWSGLGLSVYNLTTLYLYNNSDTVFVYNNLFNKFTPLFVFNVIAGDTVRLPVLPPEPCGILSLEYSDSTFSYIVDSVKYVLYDTALLKTVFIKAVNKIYDSGYVYSYEPWPGTMGGYAERIGGISSGLMPSCLRCAYLADDACQAQGQLRCYNDPSLSIKLTTDTICGLPPDAVANITQKHSYSIFPNPGNDFITIQLTSYLTATHYKMMNTTGSIIQQGQPEANNSGSLIDISSLPNGIYFIGLYIENTIPVYQRFSVVH